MRTICSRVSIVVLDLLFLGTEVTSEWRGVEKSGKARA